MMEIKRTTHVLFCVLLLASAVLAQQGSRVVAAGGYRSALVHSDSDRVKTFELDSKLMRRKINFRVILPEGYSDSRVYKVVYLLHGLFGHFENWTNNTKLIDYSQDFDFIIVTPEGGDGWYTDSVTVPNDKYESYIVQELIPEIDNRFRTVADRSGRVIAGLSMGGYGAIKFGLKYRDKFSLVGSFSGALDAPLRGQDNKNLRPSIISVFGADDNPIRKQNDVFSLLRAVPADDIKKLPFIYLACGTEDFLFQPNREFDALLLEKKVPHEYRELPGTHAWEFWDAQVKEFLQLADSHMRTQSK